jgi:hypothetical protein
MNIICGHAYQDQGVWRCPYKVCPFVTEPGYTEDDYPECPVSE